MCIGVSRIFGDNFAGVFYWNSDCFFFFERLQIVKEHKIQDGDVNKNVKCEFMVFQSSSQYYYFNSLTL